VGDMYQMEDFVVLMVDNECYYRGSLELIDSHLMHWDLEDFFDD
jgi:hypothetical protein